jgi:hypothetical protein
LAPESLGVAEDFLVEALVFGGVVAVEQVAHGVPGFFQLCVKEKCFVGGESSFPL